MNRLQIITSWHALERTRCKKKHHNIDAPGYDHRDTDIDFCRTEKAWNFAFRNVAVTIAR